MVQLATPTFLSGPQDDLASVDVYDQKSLEVINSIQDLQDEQELSLYDSLRGGAAGAMDTDTILQSYSGAGELVVNKDNLIKRLSATSSSVLSGIRNISNQVAGAINKAIPGNAPLLAKVGTIVKQVQSTNLHSLASIGGTIANLTGNPQLFSLQDQGAQIGLYSGLVQEASRLGIPNSFGELMAAVENPYILRQVALQALPTIVGTSDIHSLGAMAEQLARGNVKHMLPQVVQQFASSFQRTTVLPAHEQKHEWGQIQDTFDDIDPDWRTCRRELDDGTTEEVLSLHNLSSASEELRQSCTMNALVSEDPDEQLLVLANVFDPVTVDEHLGQEFPQTDLGWHRRMVTNPMDPITVGAISSPEEQNRPTSLRDWALRQPGAMQGGFGPDLKISAGGRLLYDGATDEGKPAPVSISGAMPPSPTEQVRPLTLQEWARRQPGTMHAGIGQDEQIYANGVLLYDGATDQDKMAPVNASANSGKTETRQTLDSSGDDSQGRDFGPSSMFATETQHEDDGVAVPFKRNRFIGAAANRDDW